MKEETMPGEMMKQFLLGMARLLDLGGVLNNEPPEKSDEQALREDWEAVGQDMRDAIRRVVGEAPDARRL